MGLFSFLSRVVDAVVDKVSDVVDYIKDKISSFAVSTSSKPYNSTDVSTSVDIEADCVKFLDDSKDYINQGEQYCMAEIDGCFTELLNKTVEQEAFSDLAPIIKSQQEKAKSKLKGTISQHISIHISTSDPEFRKILEMRTSIQKTQKMEEMLYMTMDDAQSIFFSKLAEYAEELQKQFSERLASRIQAEENNAAERIKELEKLRAEAEADIIDIARLEDEYAPAMESCQCIIAVLTEVI